MAYNYLIPGAIAPGSLSGRILSLQPNLFHPDSRFIYLWQTRHCPGMGFRDGARINLATFVLPLLSKLVLLHLRPMVPFSQGLSNPVGAWHLLPDLPPGKEIIFASSRADRGFYGRIIRTFNLLRRGASAIYLGGLLVSPEPILFHEHSAMGTIS